MCRISVPLAFALAAFSCATVLAQTDGAGAAPILATHAAAPPLTLASAVQQALAQHPDLAAARREIEAAQGALDQAGVYQNPALSVELEDLRQGRRTTTMMLSQPFELGGKRAARVTAAERAVDVARAQLQARQTDLQASVTAAFFDALIAQEGVRLAQAANVKSLAIFHHDPDHEDRFMERVEAEARAVWSGAFVARENMRVNLT